MNTLFIVDESFVTPPIWYSCSRECHAENYTNPTRTAPFTCSRQPSVIGNGNDAKGLQLLTLGRPFMSIGSSSHEASAGGPPGELQPPHTIMLLSPPPLSYIDTLAIRSTYATVAHSITLHAPSVACATTVVARLAGKRLYADLRQSRDSNVYRRSTEHFSSGTNHT